MWQKQYLVSKEGWLMPRRLQVLPALHVSQQYFLPSVCRLQESASANIHWLKGQPKPDLSFQCLN